MTSNKIIITSVVIYVIVLVIMYVSFSNQQFTGSDAAGNGMAKGLTFFYGLGILLLIAVVLTIVNAFFFKGISSTWIKSLFFVPIALPLLILAVTFFEIGTPRQASIEKQVHRLTFEIRTTESLKDGTFSFRSSKGGSHSKMRNEKVKDNYYVYEDRNAIFYENKRKFYIRFNGYETPEYYLDIPYKPQVIPFTNWEELNGINKETQDTVKLEFRYKITK